MDENREDLIKIIVGIVIFIVAKLIKTENQIIILVIYLLGYIIVGSEVVLKALKNIIKGKVFDENFLMSIATIGAFILGEYPEAMAVMLFYKIGEFCEDYSVDKSRNSISSLMEIRPDYANLKKNNKIQKVEPQTIKIDDIIVVKPGEKVPLDGIVIEGTSTLDTSALTGESMPREVKVGDDIISGCINLNGLITIKVTKEFEESTVSKILKLVENASDKKANTEKFITKFAKYYTPIVVITAIIIAIVPALILPNESFNEWIYKALTFLVVSCPCALVISIPLSFFGGIGGASKIGILIKGSNYLETLAKTDTVVFDKTGTLTKGIFKVQTINPTSLVNKDELLKIATHAESYSNHPISISLKSAYGKNIDNDIIQNVEELAGLGISAVIENKKVYIGNAKLMEKMGVKFTNYQTIGTVIHVIIDGKYAGNIVISDELKDDSKKAIETLKKLGIRKTVMLTGDIESVAQKVGYEIGIDQIYSGLLPNNKVEIVEELIKNTNTNKKLVFVGDGINDAPVLARADIGMAMGGLGSDAAIEAADIVIMTDEPCKVASAIKISRKSLKVAYENIIFAVFVKILVLILSVFGIATMWAAVFADVGVTIISILNSFRMLNVRNNI